MFSGHLWERGLEQGEDELRAPSDGVGGSVLPFPLPSPPLFSLLFRELVLRGVEIHRPGHVFYLFNYVAQQNLIVNKNEICYVLFTLHASW